MGKNTQKPKKDEVKKRLSKGNEQKNSAVLGMLNTIDKKKNDPKTQNPDDKS